MNHKVIASFGIALLALAVPAQADWFDNFNGGASLSWQWGTDGGSFQPVEYDNLYYVYGEETVVDPPGLPPPVTTPAALFGYGSPLSASSTFTDGRVFATLNPTGQYVTDELQGVFSRGTPISGVFTAYTAALNMETGEFMLGISEDGVMTTLFDSIAVPGFSDSKEYRVFVTTGFDQIVASLLDGGTEIANLSAVDTTLEQGLTGLFVSMADHATPSADIFGAFDNAGAISGIPEPSTVILMGLGGIGLAGLAWRRRRRNARA